MEPNKKISFGFSKINKKPNLLLKKPPDKNDNKVELIKCLEEKEIKLVVEKPQPVSTPLVIPLGNHTKTSTALASLQARKAILEGNEIVLDKNVKNDLPQPPSVNPENETIENRAARELLQEVNDSQEANLKNGNSSLTLPVIPADELPLDGATESTLDDYSSIPIEQFGKAMLRGMGWKDVEIKNKLLGPGIDDGPVPRPKGMGLGADKAIKRHVPLVDADPNEILEIRKKAFVKILAGKSKDSYGQIEGFDDDTGRVIVKLALGGLTASVHEFMVQPVSKKEFQQYGKVINSIKYDEYKKRENEYGQIKIKDEDKNTKLKKETSSDDDEKKMEHKSNTSRHRSHSSDYDSKSKHHYNSDRYRRSKSRDRNMRKYHHANRKHSSTSNDTDQSYDDSTRSHRKSKKKSSKSSKKKTKKSKRERSRSKGRK